MMRISIGIVDLRLSSKKFYCILYSFYDDIELIKRGACGISYFNLRV